MITKEQVKQEIDKLPDDAVEQVYLFIHTIASKKKAKTQIPSFRLKGQFDKQSIRKLAYE